MNANVASGYRPLAGSAARRRKAVPASPTTSPTEVPTAIWYATSPITDHTDSCPHEVLHSSTTAMTAMGSLAMDSASSVADRRRGRAIERRVEKTAAASVEATTAPYSKEVRTSRFNTTEAATATTAMVTTTPIVARTAANPTMGRTSRQRAVRPPSARMKINAVRPRERASSTSVKP